MRCSIPHSLLLLLVATLASANTEINNFAASERTDAPALRTRGWPTLRPHSTTRWALARAPLGTPLAAVCATPEPSTNDSNTMRCPHELWLALDIPDSGSGAYGRWTLRLSWEASTPTAFALDVLDPRAASALLLTPPEIGAPTTRRKYARIRAVDEGVRTPGRVWRPSLEGLLNFFATRSEAREGEDHPVEKNAEAGPEPVHIILTFEPLLLGVLPSSLVPFLPDRDGGARDADAPRGARCSRCRRACRGWWRRRGRSSRGTKKDE
ncbi:hypothetical protein MVEN_01499100 [Mycena venus]|uniref:Uncharacterized protein n=1 Tax=Mycena venus TaxID=2733690 RepID=A0A8H6XUH8_9AGAR|nr:hypothetical protein MVEN_01499100 [Mycena venus]